MNEQRIKARIAGRNEAVPIYEMLFLSDGTPPWNDGCGADYAEALLEKLAELLPHRRVAEPEPEKPEPIARLGSYVIQFGRYAGHAFDDTPLDYLDWLCREQEGFYKRLRAYLTHPELESRRGTTD